MIVIYKRYSVLFNLSCRVILGRSISLAYYGHFSCIAKQRTYPQRMALYISERDQENNIYTSQCTYLSLVSLFERVYIGDVMFNPHLNRNFKAAINPVTLPMHVFLHRADMFWQDQVYGDFDFSMNKMYSNNSCKISDRCEKINSDSIYSYAAVWQQDCF